MKKRLTRAARAAAAVVLAAALFGCAAVKTPAVFERSTGSLAVAATFDLMSSVGVASAKVSATNGGMRREVVWPVNGSTVAGSLSELPIGDWTVEVALLDAAGDVTHSGKATVRVYPGQTATVTLTAAPLESRVEIVADLTGFPGAEAVKNVRVTFNNDRTVTLKVIEGEPFRFSGVKELPPGDYDFSIALYGESLYASDRIYVSPWTHVRLTPGKTTRALWTAQTGDTWIESSVVDMPFAPVNLQLSVRDGMIWLSWEASGQGEVPASFRVYYQEDSFAAYELLAEVPGGVFEHPVEQVRRASPEGAVAVTAVSGAGLESYRSQPAYFAGIIE